MYIPVHSALNKHALFFFVPDVLNNIASSLRANRNYIFLVYTYLLHTYLGSTVQTVKMGIQSNFFRNGSGQSHILNTVSFGTKTSRSGTYYRHALSRPQGLPTFDRLIGTM